MSTRDSVMRCIVPECNNSGHHIVPKNIHRRFLWLSAMKIQDNKQFSIRDRFVCTLHFKDSDYVDYDVDRNDVKKRYLKRHAVPSIFPWNEAPSPKKILHIHTDGPNSQAHSDSESDLDVKDPLLGFINPIDKNQHATDTNSRSCGYSDVEVKVGTYDTDTIFSFEASEKNIAKTYSKLKKPIQFVPELPYVKTGTDANSDTTQDPLYFQDIVEDENDFINDICHSEFDSDDVAYNVEVQEEDSSHTVDIKIEESEADNVPLLPSTITCPACKQVPLYSVHHYKKTDNGIHFYTGLENFEKFIFVFHSLGSSVNHLTYYYGSPPDHLDPLEQFCLTLIILRRHREFEDLAMTYQTTKKQVSNIFITWIRFMAIQWRSIDLWIDRESATTYMPLDFHDKYPNTRVIIDATECPIKKPHLPTTQQVTFSTYKNRNTVKLLVGMAPSGLITYISPCYGGSASDRQIIERSSILKHFDFNDEIMVDKGINVQDILVPYGVKVNMPTFFKKQNQIEAETLNKDRKIASKRVHIERIIGMLKTYKILTQPMNKTETLLSSDITFVIAMLVNFRSNIMNKNL